MKTEGYGEPRDVTSLSLKTAGRVGPGGPGGVRGPRDVTSLSLTKYKYIAAGRYAIDAHAVRKKVHEPPTTYAARDQT